MPSRPLVLPLLWFLLLLSSRRNCQGAEAFVTRRRTTASAFMVATRYSATTTRRGGLAAAAAAAVSVSRCCTSSSISSASFESNTNEHLYQASSSSSTNKNTRKSLIREIRSHNLAGVVSSSKTTTNSGGEIVIPFQEGQHLVAVTGETGSGKSLLVARVVELLTGAKASATFLRNKQSSSAAATTVEMELLLRDPFLSAAKDAFAKLGLDASTLTTDPTISAGDSSSATGILHLSRTLLMQPPPPPPPPPPNNSSSAASKTASTSTISSSRIKSTCQINGQPVTLKVLTALASPLLAIVDAATAATALSKPDSRMAILDTGVRSDVLSRVAKTSRNYRTCRRERERLENELASRTLPQSYTSSSDNESDLELLNHWINELDSFETRVSKFCKSLQPDDDETSSSALDVTRRTLASTSWNDSLTPGHSATFASSMLSALTDFRNALRSLDDQIMAVRNAIDALSALSLPNSAVTAVERARGFLFDSITTAFPSVTEQEEAAEHSHDLLNDVEAALSKCTRFLEDDERGLLRTLENSRARCCTVSVESLDEFLLEWNTLARKHGISSNTLPSCHMALKSERDGNVEARTLLPKAIATEQEAVRDFQAACSALTTERQKVAATLSETVTQRLPSLGMDDSVFRVDLHTNIRKCTDSSAYSSSSFPGLDAVDFLLLHSDSSESSTAAGNRRGGKVNDVASSGEKARILLAIECALPGSIGATNAPTSDLWPGLPPIAVLYDEIDAHVGGHAAVSLARMLSDQSQSTQVVAITHSPSVAAVADMHVVIQKSNEIDVPDGSTLVRASVVDHAERRRELARMASGDLAVEEAEVFADALIRDGLRRRNGFS